MDQQNYSNSPQSIQFKAVQAILTDYFGEKGSALLKDKLKTFKLPKGTQLFKEGDEGHHMFIVLSGTLDVFVQTEKSSRLVGTVMRGECVGEMGDVCRKILTYYYFDGLSMTDISKKLKFANTDTTKTKKYKCKKKLDALIKGKYSTLDFFD